MAEVQVWFFKALERGIGDTIPLLAEPPIEYEKQTVSTTQVNFAIPSGARVAMVETDAAVAYRVRPEAGSPAVVFADDPVIAATANQQRVISVVSGGNLAFIAGA